jgi:hypothetical protein
MLTAPLKERLQVLTEVFERNAASMTQQEPRTDYGGA